MTVTSDTLKKLHQPFEEGQISWRVGQKTSDNSMGQALPFIDNRVIQAVLDSVVKPENWRNEYTEVLADGKLIAVRCALFIRVNGEWVGKEDAAPLTASKDVHGLELSLKGVYSDAMKRAAVHWGIGRYLYDFRAPWVPLTEKGRLVAAPALPANMIPEGATVRQQPEALSRAPAKALPALASAEPVKDPAPAKALPALASAEPVKDPAPAQAEQAKAETPAVVPVAHAAAPATAGTANVDTSLPAGLAPEEVALVSDLIAKLAKMAPAMIRSYIEGPKGQEKLSKPARDYVLSKVTAKEAAEA